MSKRKLILDATEEEALRALLVREMKDVAGEIHHTKTPNYRSELKEYRRHLEAILEKCGGPLAMEDSA